MCMLGQTARAAIQLRRSILLPSKTECPNTRSGGAPFCCRIWRCSGLCIR